MSIESAKAFIERTENDQKLAKRIEECKDEESFMALIKAEGYDFTVEEVKEVSAELSDEELDNAAGGNHHELPPKTNPFRKGFKWF